MKKRDVALLIPLNSRKQVLLQHRTADAPSYPNYFGFFGGGIDEGEEPKVAASRELLEELGIQTESLEKILELSYETKEKMGVKHYFAFELEDDSSVHLGEGQGYRWISHSEVDSLLINDWNKTIFKKLSDLGLVS